MDGGDVDRNLALVWVWTSLDDPEISNSCELFQEVAEQTEVKKI